MEKLNFTTVGPPPWVLEKSTIGPSKILPTPMFPGNAFEISRARPESN